jgi:hypothetical protein
MKDQVGLIVVPSVSRGIRVKITLKLPQLDRELFAADDVLTLTGKPE